MLKQEDLQLALKIALQNKHYDVVKFLLRHGCGIDHELFSAIANDKEFTKEDLILAINNDSVLEDWNLQEGLELEYAEERLIDAILAKITVIQDYTLKELLECPFVNEFMAHLALKKIEQISPHNFKLILELIDANNTEQISSLIENSLGEDGFFENNDLQIANHTNIKSNLLELALNKVTKILPHHFTQITQLDKTITEEALNLIISKMPLFATWNLQELMTLENITQDMINHALQKIERLDPWNIDELLDARLINTDNIKTILEKTQHISIEQFQKMIELDLISADIIGQFTPQNDQPLPSHTVSEQLIDDDIQTHGETLTGDNTSYIENTV